MLVGLIGNDLSNNIPRAIGFQFVLNCSPWKPIKLSKCPFELKKKRKKEISRNFDERINQKVVKMNNYGR